MEILKLNEGKSRMLYSVLFWGGLWMLIPLFSLNTENYSYALGRMAMISIGVMVLVFLNLQWLMPSFFFKKKYLVYTLIGLGLIVLTYFITSWLVVNFFDEHLPKPDDVEKFRRRFPKRSGRGRMIHYFIQSIPLIIAFISFVGSTFVELVIYTNRKEKEAIKLRSEHLDTEMKFLRSQINPHFLFNSINNIYTLTVIKSDTAPENLLKLSGMLRYMLYECNADKVALKKEIEYIQNYIDLMKLKGKDLNVETDIEKNPPNLEIVPLLLIPFIENAFKHSKIEDIENNWIKINLKTEGSNLLFECINSMPEGHFSKDKVGGIGLKNVKRRLEIMYPEKHQLMIDASDEKIFKVNLKIELE